MSGNSAGSISSMRSRRTLCISRIIPLCMNSHLPWRNGWQFVCWMAPPVEARMCASTSGDFRCAEMFWRLRSFQAGSTLWKTPGVSPTPYQPMPNPSPFVVSAPISEWRLWTISECWGL